MLVSHRELVLGIIACLATATLSAALVRSVGWAGGIGIETAPMVSNAQAQEVGDFPGLVGVAHWTSCGLLDNGNDASASSGDVFAMHGTCGSYVFAVREDFATDQAAFAAYQGRVRGIAIADMDAGLTTPLRRRSTSTLVRYDSNPDLGSGTGYESAEHRWAILWSDSATLYGVYAPTEQLAVQAVRSLRLLEFPRTAPN